MGLSAKTAPTMVTEDENGQFDIKQQFAFAASESSLSCMTSEGNLLAVAGSEEVIKIFNLKNKVSNGELSGEVHVSTITALAISKSC